MTFHFIRTLPSSGTKCSSRKKTFESKLLNQISMIQKRWTFSFCITKRSVYLPGFVCHYLWYSLQHADLLGIHVALAHSVSLFRKDMLDGARLALLPVSASRVFFSNCISPSFQRTTHRYTLAMPCSFFGKASSLYRSLHHASTSFCFSSFSLHSPPHRTLLSPCSISFHVLYL